MAVNDKKRSEAAVYSCSSKQVFLKISQYSIFPVSIAKFLWTAFFIEHCLIEHFLFFPSNINQILSQFTSLSNDFGVFFF